MPASMLLNIANRLNSYVYLYKVLGGGWVSKEEKTAAEQAAAEEAAKEGK